MTCTLLMYSSLHKCTLHHRPIRLIAVTSPKLTFVIHQCGELYQTVVVVLVRLIFRRWVGVGGLVTVRGVGPE